MYWFVCLQKQACAPTTENNKALATAWKYKALYEQGIGSNKGHMPLKITCFELTTNVIRTIILIMKTFYFGFLVAFITPTVCVASIYHEMIQQCDKAAETELENALSTVQMTQIINDQKNCYKNVVYKIIDTEYAKNKQKMMLDFDNFITNSSMVTYSMQYPDVCTPNCGTDIGLNATNADLEIIKVYIQQLLYALPVKQ